VGSGRYAGYALFIWKLNFRGLFPDSTVGYDQAVNGWSDWFVFDMPRFRLSIWRAWLACSQLSAEAGHNLPLPTATLGGLCR
jgi:hypothetical protein